MPAKWFIRRLASFLSGTKIPDLNSGFRAFRTDVARQYLTSASARVLVRHDDHDDLPRRRILGEVHPDRIRQARGQVEVPPIKDTRRYASQVVRMMLSYNPLRIFMPIGLTCWSSGSVSWSTT